MVEICQEDISWNGERLGIMAVGAPPPSRICSSSLDTLLLVGSGNPGLCHLYRDFAVTLHTTTGKPVWILGLLGFEDSEDANTRNWKEINLEMQVDIKKYVINHYLRGVKLICVDHSTSCYILTQLLEDVEVAEQIIDAYMLMPVLTRPDKFIWFFVNFLLNTWIFHVWVDFVVYLTYPFSHKTKQKMLDGLYKICRYKDSPNLAQYISLRYVRIYMRLGFLLFNKQLDLDFLTRISNRFKIICSNCDMLLHSKIRRLAETSSNGRIVNVPHVFFAGDGPKFGVYVGEWILQNQLSDYPSLQQRTTSNSALNKIDCV